MQLPSGRPTLAMACNSIASLRQPAGAPGRPYRAPSSSHRKTRRQSPSMVRATATQSGPRAATSPQNAFVPGTGWEGVTVLEASSDPAFEPQVGVDPTGNVVAVWIQ